MALRVKEVACLVGISVRTLHHYDEIGLLCPDDITEAGYRLYSDNNLATLQQILFFRELGFPLKEIKKIMTQSSFNRQDALEVQRRMLHKKRRRIEQMITTIDETISDMKGDRQMTNEDKFAGFDFSKNEYEEEARERWGDEVVNKSNATIAKKTKKEQGIMSEKMGVIYEQLAKLRHGSPALPEAQATIKKWHDFLNENVGHHYSLEAFKGLGQMYVADERFTKNIDMYGDGLAAFMCATMEIYADSNK